LNCENGKNGLSFRALLTRIVVPLKMADAIGGEVFVFLAQY
jgi:hypothetical protein